MQILGLTEHPLSAEILDMTSRTVATFRNTSTLDVSHLPQGTYIRSIQTVTDKYHLKIVKK